MNWYSIQARPQTPVRSPLGIAAAIFFRAMKAARSKENDQALFAGLVLMKTTSPLK